MSHFLIQNAIFITMDSKQPLVRGTMEVQNGTIKRLSSDVPKDLSVYNEVIDGRGKLYMPGLVNTHGHAAMSLLRGVGDDLALQIWLEEHMWPIEAKFTAEDVKYGTLLSITEMIKGGTTSFVDMYSFMDEVGLAVEQSGMRAVLARGVIGLCPPEEQQAKLEEATQFVKDWHGAASGRITTMMSPHAPYTCPPDYIEKIVTIAHELDLPIHTHMSETLHEVLENEKQYGSRHVEHLMKLGVFSRPCLVAHGVHLNDQEIDWLKEHDVRVSHNPGSNLKLASGVARLPELIKRGVKVSLGTDSAASNNNLDMFEEMRLAALIHKGVSGDPTAIPAKEALQMGTVWGAESIWLQDVGVLAEGMKADFISLDIEQPHFYPHNDLLSHIVYSASAQDVRDVWVDGKQIVKNRECLTVDEEQIRFEAQRCIQRLKGQ